MESKDTYTTKEAAEYLGVSLSAFHHMEECGLLSPTKNSKGRRWYNRKDLEKCLQENRNHDIDITNKVDSRYQLGTKIAPYFRESNIEIYCADFLQTNCVQEGTIDLIVTSPPYNVGIDYNSHDDKTTYEHYLSFTNEWLAKCYKLVKEDGRFCLNIPLDKNKGGQQSVYADITTIAKQVGWKYHSTVIWNEQNISRRTAWGSWLSASAPYVIAPVEVIVIFYKDRWKKTSGSRISDISKEEFIEWTNGVWSFMGESKKRIGHPAPFPIELPRRCIKLFSFVGDVILDPFLGSGSTLVACALTNRKGIGIEIDKNYCEIAKRRLLKEASICQLKLSMTPEEK